MLHNAYLSLFQVLLNSNKKMTNTAPSTMDYTQWMIEDEDELAMRTSPGTVTRWIGDFEW